MNPGKPPTGNGSHVGTANVPARGRLAIIGLISNPDDSLLVNEFEAHGLSATLFVAPDALVQSPQSFVGRGFELGNGALLDATIDGELGRWTLANLEAEIDEVDLLLQELQAGLSSSLFLPGHRHLVADGPYRRRMQMRYPITVSPTQAGCSILGARGRIRPIMLGHTNIDDLAPLLSSDLSNSAPVYALIVSGEPILRKLRGALFGLLEQRLGSWEMGPLRELIRPTRAYSVQ